MLIEQAAFSSRWREVSPAAKGCFAGAGMLAAFGAASPLMASVVGVVLASVAVLGARVPFLLYLRVAAPATGFLALSCLSMMVSLSFSDAGGMVWQWAPDIAAVTALTARSLGSLAALLLLVLTTPLPDLIALLRWLRLPEVLLDLMVLCYRMLFVFSEVLHDTVTAQASRLGYAGARRSLRSLGLLIASLALQVWGRAQALQQAAEARNGGGTLRFLVPRYAHARRDTSLAALAGAALVATAIWGGR